MEKPNLARMWETWIRIGPKSDLTPELFQVSIRNKISPMVSDLESRKTINWYHFLHHDYPEDPDNGYFHVRFSVLEDIKNVDDLKLPSYCVSTRKIEPLKDISGIDKTLMRDGEIEEAWRLLGKQSEWVIDLVRVHKGAIPVPQFIQFMHFFMNMMFLGNLSVLTKGIICYF